MPDSNCIFRYAYYSDFGKADQSLRYVQICQKRSPGNLPIPVSPDLLLLLELPRNLIDIVLDSSQFIRRLFRFLVFLRTVIC